MRRLSIKGQHSYFMLPCHNVINNANSSPFAHAPTLPSKFTNPAGAGNNISDFRIVDQMLLQVAIFIIVKIIREFS